MYIDWKATLRTNIGLLDLEHQMMVMMIKKLDYAIKQNVPKKLLIRTLLELKEFTKFHFISEENLMMEIGFPGYEAHEKIHSHLLAQLDVAVGRINQGLEDSEEMLLFIWEWLEMHVLNHDKEIGAYLRKNQRPTIAQNSYNIIFREN